MKALSLLSAGLLLLMPLGLTHSVEADPATDLCDRLIQNTRQQAKLRSAQRYGIFGDEEFDTIICGHLVTRQEKIWDESVNSAYFRISKFADMQFQAAIAQGIQSGNHVNALRQGQYELNLGCMSSTGIVGQEYNAKVPYLNDRTINALKRSQNQQPIAVVISFGKHPGSHCDCCNLAHAVRYYGANN
ncbi:MAG: hypothetical protein RLZZ511_3611 [Cyanobacteriota bacterium]|jgi:hypothetical protein